MGTHSRQPSAGGTNPITSIEWVTDTTATEPATNDVDDLTRSRLARWAPVERINSWYWTGLVTLAALILRMVNIQKPAQIIFDETYYANHARDLLEHGYERNAEGTGPGIAAHPPFGKWCIAFGEWLFGYNSFGWRFSAAIAGTLSVLLLIRIARRLFRSTLLGCIAGLLLTLEGLHFTSSRIALLDIFLMLFILIAFGCLVLDREHRRAQLLAQLEASGGHQPGRRGWRAWPWWRIAAAVSLGLAFSVKWSALWFALALVVLMVVWEIQARRAAGAKRPFMEFLGWETSWLLLFGVIIVLVYLATWVGWFATDGGYDRNWAADNNGSVWYLPDALVNLWHYQSYIYDFHSDLDASHKYQSSPWSWFMMDRPVLYYADYSGDCGAENCAATISGISNPLLWWSFIPAALACVWRWLVRRDWRAGTILICALVGFLPWMLYPDRTMFFFYTLPAVPFMMLAVTMMLGMVLGRPDASPERRIIGGGVVVAYLLIIALAFAYFYPWFAGIDLPYDQWRDRLWVDSWI